MRSIATALELYYADNQVHPTAAGVPPLSLALFTANGVAYLNQYAEGSRRLKVRRQRTR